MKEIQLSGGIPRIGDYEDLIKSDSFQEMEAFSTAFLNRNKHHLEEYAKKWVSDPLHQWSRQWEYPFTYSKITSHTAAYSPENPKILDAGSGVTFFPYFLKTYLPHASIYCCDCDASLESTYRSINRDERQPIGFSVSSLEDMNFENSFFDCIYCISVLEHTKNYQKIIDEFHRIMKPNGQLIVTFDISIDGNKDISPASAERLLLDLKNRFAVNDQIIDDILSLIKNPDILTTRYAEKLNPALIPWKKSLSVIGQMKSLIRSGKLITFPPLFTVCCHSLTPKNPQPKG